MKRLNVLFITRNDSSYTVPASHYFIKELDQITNLSISYQSGPLQKMINNCWHKPDIVYLNDHLDNGSPIVTGLKDVTIPVAAGLHDLHYRFEFRKRMLQRERLSYIFTYYRDKFLQWYPEFTKAMRWLPHHANTAVYKDYKLEKDIDILLTGAMIESVYPLRFNMLQRLHGKPGFQYHKHPGYRQVHQKEDVLVGESYARELNRAKICLTCDSIFHYPLMKYFEITACNALLMAPVSDELLDLGFMPGIHFVSIDEKNFEAKIDYYLQHDAEREQIARNGMHLSHTKHATKYRALEFVGKLQEIVQLEKNKKTATEKEPT